MTTVLVRDTGFVADDWEREIVEWDKVTQAAWPVESGYGLDVLNSVDAAQLVPYFEASAMIRIPFPSFADGRGFSVAKKLRQLGYKGRLRAVGHIIADQYGFALTCGFDEVEIDEDLAERQPEEQWLARLPESGSTYQEKLLGDRQLRNA